MKAWLKGGLIGGGVGLLVSIIGFFGAMVMGFSDGNVGGGFIKFLVSLISPSMVFCLKIRNSLDLWGSGYWGSNLPIFCIPILNMILYFLIGVLIVWIVRKVRNRKSNLPTTSNPIS